MQNHGGGEVYFSVVYCIATVSFAVKRMTSASRKYVEASRGACTISPGSKHDKSLLASNIRGSVVPSDVNAEHLYIGMLAAKPALIYNTYELINQKHFTKSILVFPVVIKKLTDHRSCTRIRSNVFKCVKNCKHCTRAAGTSASYLFWCIK